MKQRLEGTGVALVTPFKKNLEVDHEALKKICQHVINGGVNYLVVLGTTAETVTLSETEKFEILETVVSEVQQKIPLVLGWGGNNTRAICESLHKIPKKHFSAILSVAPYYNKPNQEGYFQHYKAIAQASPLPIILYNVPGRTGSNVQAATQLRLAHQFKNIVATKEASGNLEQIMSIIQNKPKSFQLISGDDNLTLPAIAAGASGVISVSANAFPSEMSRLVRFALNSQLPKAQFLHYKLFNFTQHLFADGNPGGIKIALETLGLASSKLRLPLTPPVPEIQKAIKTSIKLMQS